MDNRIKVLDWVNSERDRQESKWGEQNHTPEKWVGILGEEYGEFCEAINETVFFNNTTKGGYENMKNEAIQTAAVAIAFVECLERNKEKWGL
jgi:NTP pyrophosphatase (non-canonical NTP hydrolase)